MVNWEKSIFLNSALFQTLLLLIQNISEHWKFANLLAQINFTFYQMIEYFLWPTTCMPMIFFKNSTDSGEYKVLIFIILQKAYIQCTTLTPVRSTSAGKKSIWAGKFFKLPAQISTKYLGHLNDLRSTIQILKSWTSYFNY